MVQIHLLAPRGVEQLVARLAHNQKVVGSNPTRRNHPLWEIKPNKLKTHTAIFSFKKIFSSLVEHLTL